MEKNDRVRQVRIIAISMMALVRSSCIHIASVLLLHAAIDYSGELLKKKKYSRRGRGRFGQPFDYERRSS